MAEEANLTGAEELDDARPGEPVDEPAEPAGAGFMTAEQVSDLLDRHTRMMQEQNQQYLQTVQQIAQPPQQPPQPEQPLMPSQDEVRTAFETGDGNAFMDVYTRSLQALHQANQQQVKQLENAGMQRINELSQEVVKQSVPDYTRYEKEVDRLAQEYGVTGDLRANPKVVQLLVNAAKGENLDREVDQRIEARQRQAAQRQTPDPSAQREEVRAGGRDAPLFSQAAFQALRNAGRTPDQHAQQLGYANFEEYEKAAAEKIETWHERSVPAWRRKLEERRANRGRRTG